MEDDALMDRMLGYHLVMKPSFLNQFCALHPNAMPQIMSKVGLLQSAPAPDSKSKKKLVGYKRDIYRLRSGDYRILYTFNQNAGWVALLAVDTRKDIYRKGQLIIDDRDLEFDLGDVPEADVLDIGNGWVTVPPAMTVAHDSGAAAFTAPSLLPRAVDTDLLQRLRIDAFHHEALLRCTTLEDLITANVPKSVQNQLFDAVMAPDPDRLLDQPTLVVESPQKLADYYDGKLTHFLLQLDEEQQRFVNWAVNGSGPALVKGGPGTGKTIIAVYRVRSLIAALRAVGISQPRILFTAYTNSLVEASRQLLDTLLGNDSTLVTVTTADALMWDIVKEARGTFPLILTNGADWAVIEQARKNLQQGNYEDRAAMASIASLNFEFLRSEIDGVIVAREKESLDAYLAENRSGLGVRLTASQRRAIWRVHEERETITAMTGKMTFSQQRRLAMDYVRDGRGPARFDGVLIDEAQDLEPTAIRVLVALCKSSDRIFLTADSNQSIYGSHFRWADVHEDLWFRGRTGVLRKNYRSTMQVTRAADAYLAGAALEPAGDPVECAREGAMPLLRYVVSKSDEHAVIAGYLRVATRDLRIGLGSCAVLAPTKQRAHEIAHALTALGLPARFMVQKAIELDAPVVKVITMHSAKGLEFPIVAVAGCAATHLGSSAINATQEEIENKLGVARRVLYVALTRAMERLLVTASEQHPLLGAAEFAPDLWDVQVMDDRIAAQARTSAEHPEIGLPDVRLPAMTDEWQRPL